MPFEDKSETFDVRCVECDHVGMTKVHAPSRDGPTMVYKCPECGHTQRDDPDDKRGNYVSKL